MPVPGPEIRSEFESFYRRKWEGTEGYWLDWYPRHLSLYADLLRQRNRAIEAALPSQADSVLDVGCGAGDVSSILSRRARRVVSLDVARVNAERTARNLTNEGRLAFVLQAGVEDLPFADGSFDAVVMADVIEHVPGRLRAVQELGRLLRPGGLLIIVTPDKRVLEALESLDRGAAKCMRLARTLANRFRGRPPPRNGGEAEEAWEEFLGFDELNQLVRDAGLRVREHRRIAFYPGPEGGGTFAAVLTYFARRDTMLQFVVGALRTVFTAVARLEVFNQKQLIVAER